MKKNSVWVFIPWAVFWGNGTTAFKELSKVDSVKLKVGDRQCAKGPVFDAKLARTPDEKTRGLGYRKDPLHSGEGMLFVDEKPQPASFWMKETYIPLSIGFFDGTGKLTTTYEMSVEPDPSNPQRFYNAEGLALTALEVPPGAYEGLKPGAAWLCIEKPKPSK